MFFSHSCYATGQYARLILLVYWAVGHPYNPEMYRPVLVQVYTVRDQSFSQLCIEAILVQYVQKVLVYVIPPVLSTCTVRSQSKNPRRSSCPSRPS